MAVFPANSVWFTATAGGLGDFVVASAIAGYRTPAAAAVPNGSLIHYSARSATEFENGEGVYTSGTVTIARTTIFASSNANAKVNFGATPTVAISPLAEDAIFPPASSTDNAIVRWDGSAGDSVQNSSATIDDSGNITATNISGSSSGTNTGDEPTASITVEGVVELATAAEYRADTAVSRALALSEVWDAVAEVALTDAATVAWDMSTGLDFSITITATRAMGQPSNLVIGKKGRLRVVHTNASTTLTWHADYEFAGGTAPTLSTTGASTNDILYYDTIAANRVLILTGAKAIA